MNQAPDDNWAGKAAPPRILTVAVAAWLCLLGAAGCRSAATDTAPPGAALATAPPVDGTAVSAPSADLGPGVPVVPIPLGGRAASDDAQLSGLAWWEDWLVLLPQYPGIDDEAASGVAFALPRAAIDAFLDGTVKGPLLPVEVPFDGGGMDDRVDGFDGFEALTFADARAYLAIEARDDDHTQAYVVAAAIEGGPEGPTKITVDPATLVELDLPTDLENMAVEALVPRAGGGVVAIPESNGAQVNPSPVALPVDRDQQPLPALRFPTLEYRVTDATTPSPGSPLFWVLNTFRPEEQGLLQPAADGFAAPGATARPPDALVERLVPLQWSADGIATVEDARPIDLQLAADGEHRNWEGLAVLPERGFLVVTDSAPGTLFGYVSGL